MNDPTFTPIRVQHDPSPIFQTQWNKLIPKETYRTQRVSPPVDGEVYFNPAVNSMFVYNETTQEWERVDTSAGVPDLKFIGILAPVHEVSVGDGDVFSLSLEHRAGLIVAHITTVHRNTLSRATVADVYNFTLDEWMRGVYEDALHQVGLELHKKVIETTKTIVIPSELIVEHTQELRDMTKQRVLAAVYAGGRQGGMSDLESLARVYDTYFKHMRTELDLHYEDEDMV